MGTFSPFGMRRENVIATMGKLFGHGLTANIENGYRLPMQQYRAGDRVHLFGFSRRAYAVRALSGMFAHCGLIHPGQEDRVREATRLYTRQNNAQQTVDFRRRHTRPPLLPGAPHRRAGRCSSSLTEFVATVRPAPAGGENVFGWTRTGSDVVKDAGKFNS